MSQEQFNSSEIKQMKDLLSFLWHICTDSCRYYNIIAHKE